jgi:hypothetical protein
MPRTLSEAHKRKMQAGKRKADAEKRRAKPEMLARVEAEMDAMNDEPVRDRDFWRRLRGLGDERARLKWGEAS